MLIVQIKNSAQDMTSHSTGPPIEVQWHTGEPKPKFGNTIVLSVTADGDELTWLIHNFKNLPVHLGKSVSVWHGEWARFIADNL